MEIGLQNVWGQTHSPSQYTSGRNINLHQKLSHYIINSALNQMKISWQSAELISQAWHYVNVIAGRLHTVQAYNTTQRTMPIQRNHTTDKKIAYS